MAPVLHIGVQRLRFSGDYCIPERQTLARCRLAQCRRQGQRVLFAVAESAVADAPPKRKRGRPRKTQTEQPSPSPAPATETAAPAAETAAPATETAAPATEAAVPATETASVESKETKSHNKKAQETDSDYEPEPVHRLFKAPWEQLSDEEIEQQNAELEAHQNAKEATKEEQADKWQARESLYNKLIYRDPAWLELESKLLIETKSGNWIAKIGYYGRGKPQWWSLHVESQKRLKAVADYMALEVAELPNLQAAPTQPRLFETWLPSKVIKCWSLRTEKMGTKTVKWDLGQKMLVRAVMDEELYELIDNNIYVGGFQSTDVITDRNGVTHTVPKPCTDEDIAEIENWLETKEVRSKDEVMLEAFGYTDPMNTASNRMDNDKEYVEVYNDDDESVVGQGGSKEDPRKLRRYKDDAYRGSFNNPSNWYRGTSEAEAQRGQKAGSSVGPGQRAGAGKGQRAGTGQRAGAAQSEAGAGAGQDRPREATVGQTARMEAQQAARLGSSKDRRVARNPYAWDTDRSSRGQRQPRDRSFNPKDWEGVSAAPAPSARQPAQQQPVSPPPQRQPVSQPPKQQPVSQPAQQKPASQPLEQQADAKAAVPSKSPERTAAWWLGGNKPDAAGASPLDDGAGFDEWKPTGAGRKGWYNPHSSSSPGASKQDDPLQKPQSGTGDWGVQNAPITASRGQAAQPGNLEPQKTSWKKDLYRADWSRQQPQPGSADKAPAGESADYDTQLQKPVLQGRAREVKGQLRSDMRMKQLRRRETNQDPSFVGQRGAVGKSSHYDPIQKFDSVKLTDRSANWIRDEEDSADADVLPFEMPSFEHLEGEQWTADSLQFNNMTKASSGSHLDQWKNEGQDWRSTAQSPNQGGSGPSSSSFRAESITAPDDSFIEDGKADDWGSGKPSSSPAAAQQPAGAASRQDTTISHSPREPQAALSNAVSWDTGGFDFADMNTTAAEELETDTGSGHRRRVQSRADTRKPARERKQGWSQERHRGRRTDAGPTQQLDAPGSSSGQQDNAQRNKPDDDFDSFWDQF